MISRAMDGKTARFFVPTHLLGLGCTFVFAAIAGMAFAPGCGTKACTYSALDGTPAPAPDCPAGSLCYLGACLRACNAGQERVERCNRDADCPSVRRSCIDGFCSSCPRGEICIPTLDICQPVTELELPEPPPMPGPGPRAPSPLDGGVSDFPGLSFRSDAGGETASQAETTHTGFIDVAETVDYGTMPPTPGRVVSARVFKVSGPNKKWRPDLEPLAVENVVDTLGQCSLRALTSSVAVEQASIGPIRIDSHPEHPDSIAIPLTANFSRAAGYRFTPLPGAAQLLYFSGTTGPSDIRYLSVNGAGLMNVTAGAWPNAGGGFFGHQVPFELRPTSSTATLLSSPVRVPNPPAADLTLGWERINSGNDALTRVQVRIPGRGFELACSAFEGLQGNSSITVRAQLLSALRAELGPGRVPLILERASTVRLPINPAPDKLLDVTVRVRHSLLGTLELE